MAMCVNGTSECTGCMKCQEDDKPVGHCVNGHAIYPGDTYYKIDDQIYCEECIYDAKHFAESYTEL